LHGERNPNKPESGEVVMNCEELKSSIIRWMGREIDCRPTGKESVAAILPFLKPNGDAIEIGIEPIGGNRWRLSDLGETYATLYLAGVELNDEYVRAEEFRQILSAHRIADEQQELFMEASSDEMIDRIFELVHAMQSMLALQFTLKPKQLNRDFPSVVAKFLAEHNASFEVPPEPIEGKSGRWRFNFVMNHVRKETLVKALSATSKARAMRSAEESVFEINDVKAVRDAGAVVIADDEGPRQAFWHPNVLRIFGEYNVPVYSFIANRQELTQLALSYANIKS
jgi:hypothetical protein